MTDLRLKLIAFLSGLASKMPRILIREFQPKFAELDLLQLPNYSIYLKLMIDGTPSAPFSAVTLGSPKI